MAASAAKWGSTLALLVVLAAPLALDACVAVETTAEIAPDAEASHQFALRQGANLAQAGVAIVSIEGAPPAIAADFTKRLDGAAHSRDIAIVDAAAARYFVRGYLSAWSTEDGAAIEYVWDVFTAGKQRVQRLSDVIEVKGEGGGDPWSFAGEAALNSVAAKSADDLAAFLSNTPEAAPAAAAAEPPTETALGYAALR